MRTNKFRLDCDTMSSLFITCAKFEGIRIARERIDSSRFSLGIVLPALTGQGDFVGLLASQGWGGEAIFQEL